MSKKILKKKFFGEENYDFAKIQDRMYEKHESYGVLKLSKQALQKGKVFIPVLEPDKTVLNRSERFGTVPNVSDRFMDGSERF